MAYKIILKKRFTNKLIKILIYLEKEWSQKAAADFLKKLTIVLSNYLVSLTGVPSQKIKDVRAVLITRHNRIYYKVKGKKVFILNMYDTRMDPKKKPY